MSIPQKILDDLTALQNQLAASQPLEAAPRAAVVAIELNAEQLETDVTLALTLGGDGLGSWIAPRDQPGIISGVQKEIVAAADQWHLLDMLEVISRAVLNIDLMVGDVGLQSTITTTRKVLIPS
jgi:hypothetical protein